MSQCYDGLINDIDEYVDHISAAAISDHLRWDGQPRPDNPENPNKSWDVVDNSDMKSRRDLVVEHLNAKINWLKTKFGDYTEYSYFEEPERDTTPAQPLPEYANLSSVDKVNIIQEEELYNLQGIRINTPLKGSVYIRKVGSLTQKVIY